MRTIKLVLKLFELVSALKVNFHKSLLIDMHVKFEWKQVATNSLNTWGCHLGKILNYHLVGDQ